LAATGPLIVCIEVSLSFRAVTDWESSNRRSHKTS